MREDVYTKRIKAILTVFKPSFEIISGEKEIATLFIPNEAGSPRYAILCIMAAAFFIGAQQLFFPLLQKAFASLIATKNIGRGFPRPMQNHIVMKYYLLNFFTPSWM